MNIINHALRKYPVLAASSAILVAISGCGGKEDPNGDKRISEITWVDQNLANCVQEMAEGHSWQNVSEVTEIDCSGPVSVGHVRNSVLKTDDLSHFINLEKLDLSGNIFTTIDLGKLSKLEWLNLSVTYITEIDLSHNIKLQYLDLSYTALDTVDLSKQKDLTQLYLQVRPTNSAGTRAHKVIPAIEAFVHGSSDIEIFEELNELFSNISPDDIGLNAERLERLRNESIWATETDVTFNPNALLEYVQVRNNNSIRLPSFDGVIEASGHFSSDTLNGAVALKKFSGFLSGDRADFSKAEGLDQLIFSSDSVSEISIHQNLQHLEAKAAISSFLPVFPEASKLETLALGAPTQNNSEEESSKVNWDETLISLQNSELLNLKELSLFNYINPTLPMQAPIESLTFHNVDFENSFAIPGTVKNLTFRYGSAALFSPNDTVETLTLINESEAYCSLEDFDRLESLTTLHVRDCEATSLTLEASSAIKELDLSDSKYESLNFVPLDDLGVLNLTNLPIDTVDLSSNEQIHYVTLWNLPSPTITLPERDRSFGFFNGFNLNLPSDDEATLEQKVSTIFGGFYIDTLDDIEIDDVESESNDL